MDLAHILKYHLNPKNDMTFSRIDDLCSPNAHPSEQDIEKRASAMMHTFIGAAKSTYRGAFVGGYLGAGIAFCADTDVSHGALLGYALGGRIDFLQYCARILTRVIRRKHR